MQEEKFSNMSRPEMQRVESQKASMAQDRLGKIFNTALVATRANSTDNLSAELLAAMETPSFRAILGAVSHLSLEQGLSERAAAEELIKTFRKLDQIWSHYLFQEGTQAILKN